MEFNDFDDGSRCVENGSNKACVMLWVVYIMGVICKLGGDSTQSDISVTVNNKTWLL